MPALHPSLSSVTQVSCTDRELAAAFAEWHRRWVEEPKRFTSEAEALATPGQTYGESCAAYLLNILVEQAAPPALPQLPAP